MSEIVERVAKAMREAVIRDDEGEFPRLFDMLDFSGENKAHTVVNALARAAIEALREPTVAMLGLSEKALSLTCSPLNKWQLEMSWAIMIDAALSNTPQ